MQPVPATAHEAEEQDRIETIKRAAKASFARSSNWVTFYREVLGLRGIVRREYPTLEALARFEQTDAYHEIHLLLNSLRKSGPATTPSEPTEVITVRIPKSMHDALKVEAHEHHTSMNKLCISKLLQFIDGEKVPKEA